MEEYIAQLHCTNNTILCNAHLHSFITAEMNMLLRWFINLQLSDLRIYYQSSNCYS